MELPGRANSPFSADWTAAEESRQTQAQVQERSASENSEDESDEEVQAAVAPTFDKQRFSSALHADISRMLTALGLEHSNKISAGPVLLDIVRLVGESETLQSVTSGVRCS